MNLFVAKGSMMREYEGDFSFFNFLEWICLAIEDTTTRVPKNLPETLGLSKLNWEIRWIEREEWALSFILYFPLFLNGDLSTFMTDQANSIPDVDPVDDSG